MRCNNTPCGGISTVVRKPAWPTKWYGQHSEALVLSSHTDSTQTKASESCMACDTSTVKWMLRFNYKQSQHTCCCASNALAFGEFGIRVAACTSSRSTMPSTVRFICLHGSYGIPLFTSFRNYGDHKTSSSVTDNPEHTALLPLVVPAWRWHIFTTTNYARYILHRLLTLFTLSYE